MKCLCLLERAVQLPHIERVAIVIFVGCGVKWKRGWKQESE